MTQLLNKASFEESLEEPETQFAKHRSTSQREMKDAEVKWYHQYWKSYGYINKESMIIVYCVLFAVIIQHELLVVQ